MSCFDTTRPHPPLPCCDDEWIRDSAPTFFINKLKKCIIMTLLIMGNIKFKHYLGVISKNSTTILLTNKWQHIYMKCQHYDIFDDFDLYHQLIQIIENGTSANRQGGREILGDPALLLPQCYNVIQRSKSFMVVPSIVCYRYIRPYKII